jgi:hypothetical protein
MSLVTIEDAINEHICAAFDRQLEFAEFLGENYNWNIDVTAGTLTLATPQQNYVLAMQLLGTESEADGTWLWAWANDASNLPSESLHAALRVKVAGETYSIREMHDATPFEVDDTVNGHTLALMASGLTVADCYHRCPYQGGALFVLVFDEQYRALIEQRRQSENVNVIARIANRFPQIISSVPVTNHHRALSAYMRHYGMDVTDEPGRLNGTLPSGENIVATFDNLNRLTDLSARTGGAPQ